MLNPSYAPESAGLLKDLRVVQIGGGLAAAVCGRLFADIGAEVGCIDPDLSAPVALYLHYGRSVVPDDFSTKHDAIAKADLIICEGRPRDLRALHYDSPSIRRLNAASRQTATA